MQQCHSLVFVIMVQSQGRSQTPAASVRPHPSCTKTVHIAINRTHPKHPGHIAAYCWLYSTTFRRSAWMV